ncbi:hypothetical protein C7M84_009581 [Penaeus vannamei]|uniref:Uncharacterized protein n=1 Tax=Penaeus vannamei TaxID=6689 RepID=A0A423T6C2_PENVA|nr:hypothetical protein C7M84_009581 [Penaeus vannamei]
MRNGKPGNKPTVHTRRVSFTLVAAPYKRRAGSDSPFFLRWLCGVSLSPSRGFPERLHFRLPRGLSSRPPSHIPAGGRLAFLRWAVLSPFRQLLLYVAAARWLDGDVSAPPLRVPIESAAQGTHLRSVGEGRGAPAAVVEAGGPSLVHLARRDGRGRKDEVEGHPLEASEAERDLGELLRGRAGGSEGGRSSVSGLGDAGREGKAPGASLTELYFYTFDEEKKKIHITLVTLPHRPPPGDRATHSKQSARLVPEGSPGGRSADMDSLAAPYTEIDTTPFRSLDERFNFSFSSRLFPQGVIPRYEAPLDAGAPSRALDDSLPPDAAHHEAARACNFTLEADPFASGAGLDPSYALGRCDGPWDFVNASLWSANASPPSAPPSSPAWNQTQLPPALNLSDVWDGGPLEGGTLGSDWAGEGVQGEWGPGLLAVTGLALYTLALCTAVGNALVIHAIRTERRLQTVSSRASLRSWWAWAGLNTAAEEGGAALGLGGCSARALGT